MELKNFFAQDLQGNVLVSPTAYVYQPGTTTLVTGLRDKLGDGLSNPFTGTPIGQLQFRAPDGEYDLRVTAPGRDFTMRVRFIDAVAYGAELAELQDGIAELTDGLGDLNAGLVLKAADVFTHDGTLPTTTGLTSQAKRFICATAAPFNAKGDGVTNDRPAIQAAMDYVSAQGGGEVFLPMTLVGRYLTDGVLRIPSNVTLVGSGYCRYPFKVGNANSSVIVANFSNANQFVIEADTRDDDGNVIPYNIAVTNDLNDYQPAYNCGIRNLAITSTGNIPFGAIRMHGAPGSFTDGVGVDRVGCGLLANFSFGGRYHIFSNALYYGAVAWNDVNGCDFNIYTRHSQSTPTTVPSAYRLPYVAALAGTLIDTHKLQNEAHATRTWNFVVGASAGRTSIGNTIRLVGEGFSGGVFLFNAYAQNFTNTYIEANTEFAVVSARSRFAMEAFHAFMSTSGVAWDFGTETKARIAVTGIVNPGGYGYGPPLEIASRVVFESVDPEGAWMPTAPQFNVIYPHGNYPWVAPTLNSGWSQFSNVDDGYEPVEYRLTGLHELELKGGLVKAGGAGDAAFTLPAGHRPYKTRQWATMGGAVKVENSGVVSAFPTGANVWLDGVKYGAIS